MNRTRFLSVAVLLAAMLSVTPTAEAIGVVLTSKIKSIMIEGSSSATVTFVTAPSNLGLPTTPSACSARGMAIELNTEKGKALLSLALAAYLSGRTVVAQGTGACSGQIASAEVMSKMGFTDVQ